MIGKKWKWIKFKKNFFFFFFFLEGGGGHLHNAIVNLSHVYYMLFEIWKLKYLLQSNQELFIGATCFVQVQQTTLGQGGPCSRSDRGFAWKKFLRFIKKQSIILYHELFFSHLVILLYFERKLSSISFCKAWKRKLSLWHTF